MIVDQRQVRAQTLVEQHAAFLAAARRPDLTTPATEQAVHADQNAVFVIDAQYLQPGQWLTGLFGGCDHGSGRRCSQGDADPEDTSLARPGAHFQGVAEHSAQAIGNGQAQAQAFFGTGLMAVQAFEFFEDDLQLVIGNARTAVPDFQPQLATLPAHAQQDRAFAITEGVGEEVLQDPSQQFHVAVHPQAAATQAEVQALLLGQYLEFGAQGIEQFIERERFGIGSDLAVFQARDVEQIADQLFGRT
ncbi:hypothetical protein D3C77_444490 [compost metagenome]